jgi:hypothetical protein
MRKPSRKRQWGKVAQARTSNLPPVQRRCLQGGGLPPCLPSSVSPAATAPRGSAGADFFLRWQTWGESLVNRLGNRLWCSTPPWEYQQTSILSPQVCQRSFFRTTTLGSDKLKRNARRPERRERGP